MTDGADFVVHARWVIPVEPASVVWQHHSVAVSGGRIAAILPTEEARQRYADWVQVDLPRHALIPGLVNAHTHAAMTLLRGLADDLPLMPWLQQHIWPAEQRFVGPQFVRDGSALAVAEMIQAGVTCFSDMYFFGEETAQVAAAAGLRAVIGLIVFDFASAYGTDADDYLRKGLAVHDAWREHPLIRTAFAPHAPYTVGDAALARLATLAEELDLPLHMHLHETAHEVAEGEAQHGMRPLERVAQLGLLSPRLIAVHATQLLPGEIEALARHGASVVHCAESNMKLASGVCPVSALLAAGVNVAIGTDGAASNNDLDLLGELKTAGLLAKLTSQDAAAVPAATLLHMGTLGGARALGLDHEIGSLLAGKAADMVALDLSAAHCQPVHDPISQIIYAAGRDAVSDVWVAGRRLLHERRPITLDADAIVARAAEWGERIGVADRQNAG
ncbi:TRZ/ATZ family hydrolase [Immundisolibacter sp.]|uniref:TRZ/ATZ family hydrolase n=1 Tax=Immundisolibacter sp. TaxID=1934948 RepID=UPI003562F95F